MAVGLVIACFVPLATALVIGNAVTVIINPTPQLTVSVDRGNATYTNGESIIIRAESNDGTDGLISFTQDSEVIGTVQSVNGVAIFTTTAVNNGLAPIAVTFSAQKP